MLRGPTDPKSPRTLTDKARHALQLVQDALSEQKRNHVTIGVSWCLCILRTSYTPTGLSWQKGILEWLHLSASLPRIVTPYRDLVSMLIAKCRLRALTLFGSDPSIMIVTYTAQEQSWLWSFSDSWQIALANFTGQLSCHYPKDKILHFYSKCNLIFPKTCSLQPISQSTWHLQTVSQTHLPLDKLMMFPSFQTPETSTQRVELLAVQHVLSTCNQSVNIYSDSQYVVNLISLLETAPLSFSDSSAIIHLFLPLQQTICKRTHQFFIGHIHAHTDLPGPLSAGNRHADGFTRPVVAPALSPLQQAEASHALHHQNSRSLWLQFQITREQARAIVKQCPACIIHLPQPTHTRVNTRGLQPGHIFQMDVTHIASFGHLKYVHVTIDTFSHFIIASAHTGEAVKDVTAHCLLVFSNLGAPKILKTDSAPAYTGSSFQTFCSQFQVIHKTGIPYNP
ncbi:protein FAM153A isoform X1 [Callithrix jacchus]